MIVDWNKWNRQRLIEKVKCLLGLHDYVDIIEDRVAYVHFSPEHYTVVNYEGCIHCPKKRKVDYER